jgi:neurofibromin 1
MSHRCDPLFTILDDVLLSCQNAVTLDSAHKLLRTLTSNPKLFGSVDTARLLEEVLDDIGFGGLWRSSTFHAPNDQDKQCITLTDRLIEVRENHLAPCVPFVAFLQELMQLIIA